MATSQNDPELLRARFQETRLFLVERQRAGELEYPDVVAYLSDRFPSLLPRSATELAALAGDNRQRAVAQVEKLLREHHKENLLEREGGGNGNGQPG